MALTIFEAAKIAAGNGADFSAKIAREIITVDETFAVLPFMDCAGTSHNYDREKALPSAEFADPHGTAIPSTSATWDNVNAPVRTILADVDVNGLAQVALSGQTNQLASQLGQKSKAVGRKISQKFIAGGYVTSHTLGLATNPFNAIDAIAYGPHLDSDRFGPGSIRYTNVGTFWAFRAPGDRTYGPNVACAADGTYTLPSDNPSRFIRVTLDVSDASQDGESSIVFATNTYEPEGLQRLITPAQTVVATGANGDPLTFAKMDRLISMVKVGLNRAFVAPDVLIEKFYALMRSTGGAGPTEIQLPGYGKPVPTYRGLPILRNDWIPQTEALGAATNLTSMYLAAFDADEGVCAFAVGANGQAIAENDPTSRPVMGFMMERVGIREDSDNTQWRAKWYGGFCQMSTLSAARTSGLQPS